MATGHISVIVVTWPTGTRTLGLNTHGTTFYATQHDVAVRRAERIREADSALQASVYSNQFKFVRQAQAYVDGLNQGLEAAEAMSLALAPQL